MKVEASQPDRVQHDRRLRIAFAVVVGCALGAFGRRVQIQALDHDRYAEAAEAANTEHWGEEIVKDRRGDISGALGPSLAVSAPYEDVYTSARQVPDERRSAHAALLGPLFGEEALVVEAKLRTGGEAPILLKPRLPANRAAAVRSPSLEGVSLRPGQQRAHPQGSFAAQVLGIVVADEVGLSGLEACLDQALVGRTGWVFAGRDTEGEEIALGARDSERPVDGARVQLTLDRHVQRIAERELAAGIERQHATSGTVVVLDPRTGAILALASLPTIRHDDLGLYESPAELSRVAAFADAYERGSVLKTFTAAAALDAGAVKPDTTIIDTGRFEYGGGVVRNARELPHPTTMTLALQRSSRVVGAFAATQLEASPFYQYPDRFGFCRESGAGLPGEVAGMVRRPGAVGWTDFDPAAKASGQGIAVTPLQLAAATAAVANGGTLYRRYVVARVQGPLAEWTSPPTLVCQVVSPRTARELTGMMVATVDYVDAGQRRLSYLRDSSLAGRTGTAEIPTTREHDRERTIASFVGFRPAEDSRFVVVVGIDEPKENQWGESVAAPVFRSIAGRLLAYYRFPPNDARLASGGASR